MLYVILVTQLLAVCNNNPKNLAFMAKSISWIGRGLCLAMDYYYLLQADGEDRNLLQVVYASA